MKIKSVLALFVILAFLSACAQTSPTAAYPPSGSVSTPSTTAYPPPVSVPNTPVIIPVITPVPTQVYPGPTTPATEADSTLAQQAAIQEVSTKYNIPADQIKVVSTEPKTWPDGCLGVVLPGVMCAQIVTPGYLVRLEANGQQFEIHTNLDGSSLVDAAQQLATLEFVLQNTDQSIQLVASDIPFGPTYNPAFNGFLPLGGSTAGTAYVLDTSQNKAVAIDTTGQHDLTFIQSPTNGLALWRGGEGVQPRLAWGTQPAGTDRTSSLMIANADGSNLQTLLTENASSGAPIQLVAEIWSADGKSLYFSKEPVGLGGYILFSGASNLFKIDIATKQVTEIIPQAPANQPQTCLDAISGDYRFVADSCTANMITIRDLQSSTTTTLQPPTDFSGYNVMGNSRFSPAGDQLAFALAKHDPNAEQGWVAIGPSKGGTAKIILTGDKGNYYNVLGWLDDQTILVQMVSVGAPNGVNQLLAVSTDGTNVTKIADGIFLTVIDNR